MPPLNLPVHILKRLLVIELSGLQVPQHLFLPERRVHSQALLLKECGKLVEVFLLPGLPRTVRIKYQPLHVLVTDEQLVTLYKILLNLSYCEGRNGRRRPASSLSQAPHTGLHGRSPGLPARDHAGLVRLGWVELLLLWNSLFIILY